LAETDYNAAALIFDEAGQITEPDLLMALTGQSALLLTLLAGDTKQLSAVIPSLHSKRNPLGNLLAISPLERLHRAYPEIDHIVLVRNYRSHPSITPMASRLFYNYRMVAARYGSSDWDTPLVNAVRKLMESGSMVRSFVDREKALAHDNRQPFIDVNSYPVRELNGKSWCNPGGAEAVVQFAKRLVGLKEVNMEDIGIISMYREDVRVIRQKLRQLGLEAVATAKVKPRFDTSTVDAFQGKEKKIMLVHFVAAFTEGRNPFGFVRDERRLNVATTRAEEYQFLFGNMTRWQAWREWSGYDSQRTGKEVKVMMDMIKWITRRGIIMDHDNFPEA